MATSIGGVRAWSVWVLRAALLVPGRTALSEPPDPATPVEVFAGLGADVGALAVARDGNSIVVAGAGDVLRVVDLATRKSMRSLKDLTHDVESLAFPGGDRDVVISMPTGEDAKSRSVLRCWDWSTGTVRQDIDTSSSAKQLRGTVEIQGEDAVIANCMAFSADGLRLLRANTLTLPPISHRGSPRRPP